MATTRETELLPCPFCGCEKIKSASDGWGNVYHQCLECGARGPSRGISWRNVYPSPEAWNTRAK